MPAVPGPAPTLIDIPNELLLRVVSWLDEPAVRAFGQTSRRVNTLLDQDVLGAMRLAERIRWVVSPSGFADMALRIALCPAAQRSRLTLQLAQRQAALHPSHLPGAQQALASLMPANEVERLMLAHDMERWRKAQQPTLDHLIPSALPPLEQVLALPGEDRAGVLAQWIDVAGHNGIAQRSPPAWHAILAELPRPGRDLAWCRLVSRAGAADPVLWKQILEAAVDIACAMLLHDSPASIRLLSAVASATGHTPPGADEQDARIRRDIWERVLGLALSQSAHDRRALLTALAGYPLLELCAVDDLSSQTLGTDVPAWRKLIQEASKVVRDPGTFADIVCAMLDGTRAADAWYTPMSRCFPMLKMAIAIASNLSEAHCTRILTAVLGHREPERGALAPQLYERIWNAVFVASERAGPQYQAQLVAKLTETLYQMDFDPTAIDGTNPTLPTRWLTLLNRIVSFSPPVQLEAAANLAMHSQYTPESMRAEARLLQFAITLGDADRAELLQAMLNREHAIQPGDWRDLVNQVADLPGTVRVAPVRMLVRQLVTHYSRVFPALTDPGAVAPARQSDMQLASWPRTYEDALRLASAALRLMPVGAVAAELMETASQLRWSPWRAAAGAWLLHEMRQLPANGRHEVVIVTSLCATMARICKAENTDAVRAFLPDIWSAVLALAPQHRAGALAWLADVVAKLDIGDPWPSRLRQALQHLPEVDRPVAGALKRKAPPL